MGTKATFHYQQTFKASTVSGAVFPLEWQKKKNVKENTHFETLSKPFVSKQTQQQAGKVWLRLCFFLPKNTSR